MSYKKVGDTRLLDFRNMDVSSDIYYFIPFFYENYKVPEPDKTGEDPLREETRKAFHNFNAAREIVSSIEDVAFLRAVRLSTLKRFIIQNRSDIEAVVEEFHEKYTYYTKPNYDAAQMLLIFEEEKEPAADTDQEEPDLKNFPPFREIVERFIKSRKRTKLFFSNEQPDTYKTVTTVPEGIARMQTQEVKNAVEKYAESFEAAVKNNREMASYIKAGGVNVGKMKVHFSQNSVTFTDREFTPEAMRFFLSLAIYWKQPENEHKVSKHQDTTPPQLTVKNIDFNELALIYSGEDQVSPQRLYQLKKEISNIIGDLDKVDRRTITIQHKDKVILESCAPIIYYEFVGDRTGVELTVTMPYTKLGFHFPDGITGLPNRLLLPCFYIYTVRNQKIKGATYYNVPSIQVTVGDLIRESKLTGTYNGKNRREAIKKLREILSDLQGRNLILGYEPERIPHELESTVTIFFTDDPNVNSRIKLPNQKPDKESKEQ